MSETPRLPIRGGGNGRAHGIPSEMFEQPKPSRRSLDWRGITTGVLVVIAAAIVSGIVSFWSSSLQAADQVRDTTVRIHEMRADIADLQRKQAQADIDAARLAGNYEAVVKGVDQRLQTMQNQLDRIERQR